MASFSSLARRTAAAADTLLEHARSFRATFFTWYNTQHRHWSLVLLPPADVHYGRGQGILAERAKVLRAAFEANPKCFKGRAPTPATLPAAVWINPPMETPDLLTYPPQ